MPARYSFNSMALKIMTFLSFDLHLKCTQLHTVSNYLFSLFPLVFIIVSTYRDRGFKILELCLSQKER